ncbi:MAG TPA: hypothetical protein VHB47_14625 [Thermoanaerobaculia bacterium]|nr:hypothetical protein [Thermoanaerobaculia bacterium]
MPRKNRCTALVLVLALLACLAGQAAAAMPAMGSRAAANASTGGDLLSAVWEWLADKWAALGHVIAAPVRQEPGAWQKTAAGVDPNGGCAHPAPQDPTQP